eukprot:10205256-Karenia_brevis.AAC.1
MYRFRVLPTREELARHARDGQLIIGERGPAAVAAPRASAAGQVLAGARRGPRPAAAPAGAVDRVWVCMEDAAGFRRGDVVPDLSEDGVFVGDRAVHVENGEQVACRLLPRAEIKDFISEDLRVLPVRFDQTGKRRRPFNEGVEML